MATVEIICIGSELLDGSVRDANAAALGAALASHGTQLDNARFIGDAVDVIEEALRDARADLVVVCGGLGPTVDDVTRDAAARFSKSELALVPEALEHLESRFAARGRAMTPNNLRQAMLPAGSTMLPTEVGTAPGFKIDRGGRLFYFLPGVPHEFRWFLERFLEPLFPEPVGWTRRLLQFHGLGESALETEIADVIEDATTRGLVVGYRAAYPVIELKLTGEPDLVAETRELVLGRLAAHWVGEDDTPLPARLGQLLLDRGETITTAESCTAGGIAALLTEVSGSSAWFGRGWVTYANDAKAEELGVLDSVLLAHGAVSPQTVCQMAAGARRRARTTYAVAVSGIAGPSGGTPQKPVGTVHFGLATPIGVYHRHVRFHGDRQSVRAGTAFTSLAMLLSVLQGRPSELGAAHREEDVWAEGGIDLQGAG